jgi:hypothetical protein
VSDYELPHSRGQSKIYNGSDEIAILQKENYQLKLSANEARFQEGILRSDVLSSLNKIISRLDRRAESYYSEYSDARHELEVAIGLIRELVNDMEPKNA